MSGYETYWSIPAQIQSRMSYAFHSTPVFRSKLAKNSSNKTADTDWR